MLFITSLISLLTFRGNNMGHFKYSSAKTEAMRPFCEAHIGSAPPPLSRPGPSVHDNMIATLTLLPYAPGNKYKKSTLIGYHVQEKTVFLWT